MNLQRHVFRVRAVITDQGQPMNSSLEEVLSFVPRNRFKLNRSSSQNRLLARAAR
jgi:hypothetical protein